MFWRDPSRLRLQASHYAGQKDVEESFDLRLLTEIERYSENCDAKTQVVVVGCDLVRECVGRRDGVQTTDNCALSARFKYPNASDRSVPTRQNFRGVNAHIREAVFACETRAFTDCIGVGRGIYVADG